jgi:hypothetical protein
MYSLHAFLVFQLRPLAQAVSELLGVLGFTGEEAVQVPSWHYTEDPHHTPGAAATAAAGGGDALPEGSMRLRHALTSCYDLHTPRAEPLLQLMLLGLQQELRTTTTAAPNTATTAGGGAGNAKGGDDIVSNGTATAAMNGVGHHVNHYKVVATVAGSKAAAAAAAGAVDVQVLDQEEQKRVPAGPGAAAAAGSSVAAKVEHIQQLLGDKQALEAYLADRHVVDICRDFRGASGLTVQQVRLKGGWREGLGCRAIGVKVAEGGERGGGICCVSPSSSIMCCFYWSQNK